MSRLLHKSISSNFSAIQSILSANMLDKRFEEELRKSVRYKCRTYALSGLLYSVQSVQFVYVMRYKYTLPGGCETGSWKTSDQSWPWRSPPSLAWRPQPSGLPGALTVSGRPTTRWPGTSSPNFSKYAFIHDIRTTTILGDKHHSSKSVKCLSLKFFSRVRNNYLDIGI